MAMHIRTVEPTVFFVRDGDALRQLARVRIGNDRPGMEASLRVRAEGVDEAVSLGLAPPGEVACEAYLPDIREPTELRIELWTGETLADETTVAWTPQKHWEVHLIQYAHHDLGYTDLPSNVLAEYDGFMDRVLDYCAETEHWPDVDARFRYQCEQAWSVLHYLENRPQEVVYRLVQYLQNGQIELTALYGNQTLELCGTEEMVRLLYPAFGLKRAFGIEVSSAEHNDIPGFPWGLASVLAGAGVRYFSPGVPLWYFGRGEERVHPLWDTEKALPLDVPAACWWEGPDGARVLLWSDLHGQEWQPYNVDQALSELPGMLARLDERGYPYDMVSYTLRGGHRDNAPPTIRYAYMVKEWNERWAYPRLINTTNTPYLRAFEARWGDALVTLRGDVPGTDYPAGATCTPNETAIDRNTHEQLMTAEKLASLASLTSGAALAAGPGYPRGTLDRAYRDTFTYDLHCWGLSDVGGPGQDGHWSEKGGYAYRAAALAHDVAIKAANALADRIAYPGEATYLTAFNALGHERTDVVRAPLRDWEPCSSPMYWRGPDEEGGWPAFVSGRAIGRRIVHPPAALLEQPFELVDASTGERVPYQVSTLSDPQAARRWAPERFAMGQVDPRHLKEIVFLARGLPSMGYKTYQIVPCERWPEFGVDAAVEGTVVENSFYRLEIDPREGAIASLYDKALGRELVDVAAGHAFGQLIVRESGTAREEVLRVGDVAVVESGALYTTVRLKGEVSSCPRVTIEITLHHTIKRIDWAARILRDSTPMRELYVAFPFEVENPRFHFEAGGAVIEPLRDQWPGSNTDDYAVQHWVDVSGDDWGVAWTPVDTPMAEFGGLWPGYVSGAHHGVRGPGYGHPFLRPGELERGHLYSLVSYNNFRTNFINVHAGEFVVRYAFTSHGACWPDGDAQGFGWGVTNPPLAVWMEGPQEGTLPVEASWVQLDAPNVVLLTLKRAEDGDGYIVRLMETRGCETEVTVSLPRFQIRHAFGTNLVEENQRLLSCSAHAVRTTVRAFGLATIRIGADL
jgi:alpha-mannosidase